MLANKLLMVTSSASAEKLYVDDVFSTYLYTGNGATQTINNGIDLAGEGGLVWLKVRSSVGDHFLMDSSRSSFDSGLKTSTTAAELTGINYIDPTSTGFNLNSSALNGGGYGFVSWTFRKAPKFFDIQVFNNNASMMPHNLGAVPGMVIMKALGYNQDWFVWHRGRDGKNNIRSLKLNTVGQGSVVDYTEGFTATHFSPSYTSAGQATDGAAYVAYLFAHDPSADGFIQCGSYTGNGSATGPIVNLGWEPQYLMLKNATGTGGWQIIDSMRGMPVGSADATLQANLSNAESSVDYISPTATGFQLTSTSSEVNASGSTYIYLAIRRPNKPPTTGTEVYNAIARTGTGAAATITGVGFAPDALLSKSRNNAFDNMLADRLTGPGRYKFTNATLAEGNAADAVTSFNTEGISVGADTSTLTVNNNGGSLIHHFFKRAPGFMDVVCYTGDGTNPRALSHSLGTPVEFGIIKARSSTDPWTIKASSGANVGRTSGSVNLNATFGYAGWETEWSDPSSTASLFYVNASGNGSTQNNTNGITYVAYLFATKPGISKVGSYTGNGTTQTINCGFATGARFILIKRANAAGDWYVWDTARGIISANDPHLSLNTTAAEVTTDDSVDPDVSGFIVNQNAATNINVSGGQYIFLAIA